MVSETSYSDQIDSIFDLNRSEAWYSVRKNLRVIKGKKRSREEAEEGDNTETKTLSENIL